MKADASRRTADSRVKPVLIKGSKALERGDYRRALTLADSAEKYEPDLPLIHFFRGSVYAEQNKLEAARNAYQKVLELDPTYPEVRLKLGNLAFDRGRFRTALRLYRKEKEVSTTSSLHVKIARTYQKLSVTDSARIAYEKALSLDSTNANAHMMYGQFLENQGNLETALSHSRKALELDPENINYQFAVGSQLYRTGHLEEAVKYLKRAADERLLHSAAQHNLGQVLERLGKPEKANYYFTRADSARRLINQISSVQKQASQNSSNVSNWIRLGKLYFEAGALDRALQAYRRAVRIQPGNLTVQHRIAETLLRKGAIDDAIQRFRSVLEAEKSYVDAWLGLGLAYATDSRCQEARRAWKRALKYQPSNAVAERYLNDRCRGTG
ncbi:MAG: tetratricopeptide repeat protein [Salinivenus sp.]